MEKNEMTYVFVPNGVIQTLIDNGSSKDEVMSLIEFLGHEAGEFVPAGKLHKGVDNDIVVEGE